MDEDGEEARLRSVALQNATAILQARQRTEEALAHSLALMRATLDSTADGILATDDQGAITAMNARLARMWAVGADAPESRDHQRFLDLCSRRFAEPAAFLERTRAIAASTEPESFDVLELADGTAVERFSKIQLVGGRVVGRVWSYRDITPSRRTEESLRDETRVLELLNEMGITIAGQLDLRALVQAVTDATTQITGAAFGAFFYTVHDAAGGSFMLYTLSGAPREAFEHFGHPRATALFGPTFDGGPPIRIDDVLEDPRYGHSAPHYGMPPGHLPVRSYLAVPVRLRSGEVIGGLFFGHPRPRVFTERTERIVVGLAAHASVAFDNARLFESERAARAEAERSSHLKEEFLVTLSHELRTPMNAIVGWARFLQVSAQEPDVLRKGLETIGRNADVQVRLIEDLLDMSRIASGKMRLDVQPVMPSRCLEAALETVAHAAQAKGVRLEKTIDPLAGPITGDPSRLQQIMWNLLLNAVKFTPRGGKVHVVVARVNSHVEITVSDTGVGIAPEFLPHVFERFRQGDGSSTRTYGGLGLGLSIVKHLTEMHGGRVTVTSEGTGTGATFVVHLPLAAVHRLDHGEPRAHPNTPVPSAISLPLPDLSGLKVLVVDDEPDACELMQRVLSRSGAAVITAHGALEALELIESERPDVLLSDIGMPAVDGYELLRRARALDRARGRRMPAVALTAFARVEDRTRALRAGYAVHLAKPIDAAELIATIASVAGRADDLD